MTLYLFVNDFLSPLLFKLTWSYNPIIILTIRSLWTRFNTFQFFKFTIWYKFMFKAFITLFTNHIIKATIITIYIMALPTFVSINSIFCLTFFTSLRSNTFWDFTIIRANGYASFSLFIWVIVFMTFIALTNKRIDWVLFIFFTAIYVTACTNFVFIWYHSFDTSPTFQVIFVTNSTILLTRLTI